MANVTNVDASGNGCVKVSLDDGAVVVLATRGKSPDERRASRDAVVAALKSAIGKAEIDS